MAIKVLAPAFMHPTPEPIKRVRCDYDIPIASDWDREWRQGAYDRASRRYAGSERPRQCTFNAVVEMDGVPLCRRHAGQLVLERYIKGEIVDKEPK